MILDLDPEDRDLIDDIVGPEDGNEISEEELDNELAHLEDTDGLT